MNNKDEKAARLPTKTLQQAREKSGLSVRQLETISGVAKSSFPVQHEGRGSARTAGARSGARTTRTAPVLASRSPVPDSKPEPAAACYAPSTTCRRSHQRNTTQH